MTFWHDCGSPRRSRQCATWLWNPENNVLRKLGGRVNANIVDDSWFCTGPPPLPPPPQVLNNYSIWKYSPSSPDGVR
eukprot:1889315-Pyramimonas_sp.AAC.1